jgi:chaperonin cofactor prefoldin
MEQIKLSDDLLLEIQSLRDDLTENVVKIGRLSVQTHFYERELENLKHELLKLHNQAEILDKREQEMQERIAKDYGNGQLEMSTGIYTKA